MNKQRNRHTGRINAYKQYIMKKGERYTTNNKTREYARLDMSDIKFPNRGYSIVRVK